MSVISFADDSNNSQLSSTSSTLSSSRSRSLENELQAQEADAEDENEMDTGTISQVNKNDHLRHVQNFLNSFGERCEHLAATCPLNNEQFLPKIPNLNEIDKNFSTITKTTSTVKSPIPNITNELRSFRQQHNNNSVNNNCINSNSNNNNNSTNSNTTTNTKPTKFNISPKFLYKPRFRKIKYNINNNSNSSVGVSKISPTTLLANIEMSNSSSNTIEQHKDKKSIEQGNEYQDHLQQQQLQTQTDFSIHTLLYK